MQANGAEMLRLACCLATERGIRVCMPVHDAILIEADIGNIDETVEAAQSAMTEASRVVLNGFELRSDVKVIQQNERYSDKRGETMWNRVMMHLLAEAESGAYCSSQVGMSHPRRSEGGYSYQPPALCRGYPLQSADPV
jgi:hypothetical protein